MDKPKWKINFQMISQLEQTSSGADLVGLGTWELCKVTTNMWCHMARQWDHCWAPTPPRQISMSFPLSDFSMPRESLRIWKDQTHDLSAFNSKFNTRSGDYNSPVDSEQNCDMVYWRHPPIFRQACLMRFQFRWWIRSCACCNRAIHQSSQPRGILNHFGR